jgi:hypothetical protein
LQSVSRALLLVGRSVAIVGFLAVLVFFYNVLRACRWDKLCARDNSEPVVDTPYINELRKGCRSERSRASGFVQKSNPALFSFVVSRSPRSINSDRVIDPFPLEEDGFMPQAKYRIDRRVDDYINSLPSWQQEVCRQVRDLVHAADADVSETIKRTKLPYFTLDGNICALLGTKDHVNIFHL